MLDKYKDHGKTPLQSSAEKGGKPKTPIEREENEDLEVDEGLPESGPSKAEQGMAETPAHTGGEPKAVRRKSANDVSNPEAVVGEPRSQDA